jgi:hypothetical protein
VELKSHILRKEEWKTKAEWSLAAKIMRMLYRRAGYDYPLRLIYFVERDGAVAPEEEAFINPENEDAVLNIIRERMRRLQPSPLFSSQFQPRGEAEKGSFIHRYTPLLSPIPLLLYGLPIPLL